MKISVIIPTLNAERWIVHQLDMLLSQTVEVEIIVIDSGSADGTPGIVRRFAPRVRLIEIPNKDFDHGGTRDFALRQSTGDYVLTEGWRMLRFVCGELARRRQYSELLTFYTHVGARFAGNRVGKSIDNRSRKRG